MVAEHGIFKVMDLFSGEEIQFADPIGIGMTASLILSGFAEFIGSILLFFGLATRFAAFVLVLNMGVAFFIEHGSMEMSETIKQLDLILLTSYVFFLIAGSGRYSLDRVFSKK